MFIHKSIKSTTNRMYPLLIFNKYQLTVSYFSSSPNTGFFQGKSQTYHFYLLIFQYLLKDKTLFNICTQHHYHNSNSISLIVIVIPNQSSYVIFFFTIGLLKSGPKQGPASHLADVSPKSLLFYRFPTPFFVLVIY